MSELNQLSLDELFELVRSDDPVQSAAAEAAICKRNLNTAGRHAAVAIMMRNMSHNLGGHVLAALGK